MIINIYKIVFWMIKLFSNYWKYWISSWWSVLSNINECTHESHKHLLSTLSDPHLQTWISTYLEHELISNNCCIGVGKHTNVEIYLYVYVKTYYSTYMFSIQTQRNMLKCELSIVLLLQVNRWGQVKFHTCE